MNVIKYIVYLFVKVMLLFTWLGGIVLAKGFWWTALAIVCPFYSWYLVIKQIMLNTGFM